MIECRLFKRKHMSNPIEKNSVVIYRRLLEYIRPHLWRFAIAVVCMVGYAITVALASAIPYLTISGLTNKREVILSSQVISHLPFEFDIRFDVFWLPILIFAIIGFKSFFDYVLNYQMTNVGIRAVRKVREDLFAHLTQLSSDFYSRGRTGDFLSRITNDVSAIQGGVTDVLTDLVKQPITVLFLLPPVFLWGGPSGLIAVGVFSIVALPIVILGKSLRRTTKKMQERTGEITAFIGESLMGMTIVKAFNQENRMIDKFNSINRTVFDHYKKTIRVTILQRPMIEMIGAAGAALAVGMSVDQFTPERFTSFLVALFLLYEPVKKISKVNNTIQQSVAAGQRIFEILDEVPSVRNLPGAVDFKEPVRGVVYDKISFKYQTGGEIFSDFSLSVKAGEVLAIVGQSGSGKSTLVNLLPRFYDPSAGSVRVNGTDLRNMTLKSLRDMIAIVTQDTILFNGTVRENIAYANPQASMAEVETAAKAAQAHTFISAMPQGYDTNIGDRGMNLSGGQRQRLSIARALLKNPPILILDEATSNLDTQSEFEVQIALENLMKGRTVFVIAHRLSTVKKANRIIVMRHGKVIEEGTHDVLLAKNGIYKDLYDLQFSA